MHAEVIREVEQFLYREARLLDERRFHEWLELFTDDVRYWMPVRSNRYPKSNHTTLVHANCRDLNLTALSVGSTVPIFCGLI
jgi:3-phenylpropionate/cinnamic acid dioxygenase small subunit